MCETLDQTLVIETATSSDLPEILRIADARLGASYMQAPDILGAHRTTFAAFLGHRLVGFLSASILSLADFRERYARIAQLPEMGDRLTDPMGILHVAAVDARYEKRGIGTALIAHGMTLFAEPRPLTIVTAGWADNQGVHIAGPVRENGFQKVGYLKDYWQEDSLARGYECPTCGKPPCRCVAGIFAQTLR